MKIAVMFLCGMVFCINPSQAETSTAACMADTLPGLSLNSLKHAPACLGIGGGDEVRVNQTDKDSEKNIEKQKNVIGSDLMPCGTDPLTGFYRTGSCDTGPADSGVHTVCAVLSLEFLDFTKKRGNDLSTPMPQFGFPGLKPGQRWCVCAARWLEAEKAGVAPKVILESTHEKTLLTVPLEKLKAHATAATH